MVFITLVNSIGFIFVTLVMTSLDDLSNWTKFTDI